MQSKHAIARLQIRAAFEKFGLVSRAPRGYRCESVTCVNFTSAHHKAFSKIYFYVTFFFLKCRVNSSIYRMAIRHQIYIDSRCSNCVRVYIAKCTMMIVLCLSCESAAYFLKRQQKKSKMKCGKLIMTLDHIQPHI